jgi:transposase
MSRLECVRETLRLALAELDAVCEKQKPEFWPVLWERYVQSNLDYRVELSVLEQKMKQAGSDAWQLLQWLESQAATVQEAEQVRLLRKVWNENFEVDAAGQTQQHCSQPAGAVHNPHDPEAQWAAKGVGKNRKEHVGYKVQVAESVASANVAKGEPTTNFITAIVTQPAIASDDAGLPLVEEEQRTMGLDKPSELYVDGAYISAERLAQAREQERELIGPAQAAPHKEGRFSVEEFEIDVEARKAICPSGKENTQCSRLEEESTGKVTFRFEWSYQCRDCPLREQCLGKDQRHRTIVVGEHHTLLQARRREQQTEAFKLRARRRNAIEGTQSELVRAHGLRRARYRGLSNVRLQNYFIGAACNIKRWLRRKQWLLRQIGQTIANSPATAAA